MGIASTVRRPLIVKALALLMVALCAVAGAYWARRQAAEIRLVAKTVQLDGYALSVWDDGAGQPALVIEAGLACTKDLYERLHFDLSKRVRTITYDHAGIGASTPSANPRTLPSYVKELRELLAKLKVPPPYILVGHSLGGHIIRYYAHLHPQEVAGLVFIDHPHEDWFKHIRQTWPKDVADKYFEWWTPEGSTYKGVALTELLEYEHNCDLVRGILPPKDIPVLMFTANNEPHYQPGEIARDQRKWAELQASLIAHVQDAKHIVDWEIGHVGYREKPEMFAREIGAFIDKVAARAPEP